MADEAYPSSGSDHFLMWGVGLLVLVAALNKITEWFDVWIQQTQHQLILAATIGLSMSVIIFFVYKKMSTKAIARKSQEAVIGPAPDAVFCGASDKNEPVFIKPNQRGMHTQIIGTTNAGKTESVILPWAIQDIQQGRGLLLIDGKADRSLLDKLWSYTVEAGRESDFRLFSLSNHNESQSFNPLIGGSAEEITERIFNAFDFENPFYRSVQYEVLSQVLRVFEGAQIPPTFIKIHQAIANPMILEKMVSTNNDSILKHWVTHFRNLSGSERAQRTSGLTSQIGHFAFGKAAKLFNQDSPMITIDAALKKNQIVYFQLPALLSPFLGKATGKLVLQSLQAAVANRHRAGLGEAQFYSVFLDDFAEYLYPGFVTVLNKSRSAKVGIVFAHQALGDIEALGDSVANAILTNSNIKVFMRGNDPDSAEYFAKVIGTTGTVKFTERRKMSFMSEGKTGDVSAREVEEFVIHPNYFKRELGVGQAVMIVPHAAGSRTLRIKFTMFPDLEIQPMSKVSLPEPTLIEAPADANDKKRPIVESLAEAISKQSTKEFS
jgi:type IV secretory pathway TraG/TraD family ATPase VirD4